MKVNDSIGKKGRLSRNIVGVKAGLIIFYAPTQSEPLKGPKGYLFIVHMMEHAHGMSTV